MRIVLLGPPGSGKGTQARLLSEKYKIPHVSTGDLLRAAVSSGSDLGRRAKADIDAGRFVSDDIVLGIIQERLSQPDARPGFVLDGFPRNIPQAQALDATLARLGQPLQLALLVDVERELLKRRITGRRTCSQCGAIYNIHFSPPKVGGKCDRCGGTLVQRSDDTEEVAQRRLQVYEEQTAPLVAYYRAQGKLRTVRGVGSIDEIFKNVTDIVEAQIRPLAAVLSQTQAAARIAPEKAEAAPAPGAAHAAPKRAAGPAAAQAAGAKPAPKSGAKAAAPKAGAKAQGKTKAKGKAKVKAVKAKAQAKARSRPGARVKATTVKARSKAKAKAKAKVKSKAGAGKKSKARSGPKAKKSK